MSLRAKRNRELDEDDESSAPAFSKQKQDDARSRRRVRFAPDDDVHVFYSERPQEENEPDWADGTLFSQQGKTSQLTVLSSLHGQSRRELRNIENFDLQSAVKYGVKTRANKCPKTLMPRWKYEYGNIVYITDHTSTVEVTSYKQPITIHRASITGEMVARHNEDVRAMHDDPQLCTTHSVIIIDQSGSMRTCDVAGFRTRSDAAYGILALEYIAEQLHTREGEGQGVIDAVTVIEMNDTGSLFVHREPLDWILFNKILDRQKSAKPKSHGNYNISLTLLTL